MRRIKSLFTTLLMLIPMTAVPVMAILGIPQFVPVSASPSSRSDEATSGGGLFERRAGQSHALLVRNISTEPAASLDLFQPYDAAPGRNNPDAAGVVANAASSELERRRLNWTDPLSNGKRSVDEQSTTSFSGQAVPAASGTRSQRAAFSTTSNGELPDRRSSPGMADRAFTDQTLAGFAGASPGDNAGRYAKTAVENRSTVEGIRQTHVESFSWQEAVDRLKELGIRTFRLSPDSGQSGYCFVCLVTSVEDPRVSRRFEAEATDPLLAVGRVLAQVEDWNQHQ
ncbi:MAG: hypothetical protein O3B13_12700 [Planctomycetota bacterium]|nr:hypothetical protein [Planctomycetota bacterium]